MGWKQDQIVSLKKQLQEQIALRTSDNKKFIATLAKERASHQEATKGLSEAVMQLQVILEALKGLIRTEVVPPFTPLEISSDQIQERWNR